MKDPLKQRELNRVKAELEHLYNCQDKLDKRIRRIREALLNETDATQKDKYDNDLLDCQKQSENILKQIQEAKHKKQSLEEELKVDKDEGEETKSDDFYNDSAEQEPVFSLAVVKDVEKEKYGHTQDQYTKNSSGETDSISPQSLFKENELIGNTVLYVATFFPELSPYDFDRVVTYILGDRKTTVLVNSQKTTKKGNIKAIEIPEEKLLRDIWKESLYKPDNYLIKNHLNTITKKENLSKFIGFELPNLAKKIKNYLEEKQSMYLEEQFKLARFLLFDDNSVKVAENAMYLSVEMALAYPNIHGEDWLFSIIVGLTEEADWNVNPQIDPGQLFNKLLTELAAEKKRKFFFGRISNLIYQMLEFPELQDKVRSFLDRLMSVKRYDAVLAIVKNLRFVSKFNGLYWVKRLLDEGNKEICSDTYNFLLSWLKQSGSRIYELLDVLKQWLPKSSRSPDSDSSKLALRLFLEYCIETTERLDKRYYGYWPSKYQLFAPLRDNSVESKLETLVSWLFHPSLKYVFDEDIDNTQLLSFLVAQWLTILCGWKKKETNPRASEVANSLIRQVIVQTDRFQQEELLESWREFAEYLRIEAEAYGEYGKQDLRRQSIRLRNQVRQLMKRFSAAQKEEKKKPASSQEVKQSSHDETSELDSNNSKQKSADSQHVDAHNETQDLVERKKKEPPSTSGWDTVIS